MTYPAKTVLYFGIYLLFEGAILFFVPNVLLSLAGLPETNEVWIRLVGMSLLILGYYYIRSAYKELKEFFYWTVQIRILQFFVIISIVLFNLGEAVLISFAFVEFVSGLWTWRAIKKG
ncbi:MAG: hypothetical protein ACD_37C00684G0007 [uncultured bacterium]|nr:MAG: hypothetical protein ACD_37C00684G0007 [uncultured bacterium]OGH13924.1 MAG: hypothetical protein A2687_03705 [Candidatus Levybacteria bacterium RIFCSPHIGHO2_01_FULL_38_26]